MYTAIALVSLGTASLWSAAAACQYTEHSSAVLAGNDALRVPLASTGAGAQNECAATAEAFGLSVASIVPSDQGGAECVLYGGQGASDCGDTYELMPGAKTLSDISACDAATVKAVGDAALVFAGSGQKANVGTSSGVKVINTAAVGKAVHSDLSFVTEEECLVACAQYVEGCTHVTTVVAQGKMARCSFHGSPAKGVQVQGANTYYNIVPSPQLAARALGSLSTELGTGAATNVTAAAPAVAPVIAPTAPAPAPVVEAPAPAGAAPMGVIEELVYTPPGTCPSPVITDLPAGKKQDTLDAPDEVIDLYGDVLTGDGEFPMTYGEIVNGGAYCVAKGSTAETVIVGGTFLWEVDGECVAPPVNAAGEACCEVFMWQPNTAGLYYDNCSMKMAIQPDGLYYFETEMPGDESLNGWGPDPKPHIHFDIQCTGCSGDHPAVGGDYHYWNKLYPEELCLKNACGNQGPVHQATVLAAGGKTVYKYDMILPVGTRTSNQGA